MAANEIVMRARWEYDSTELEKMKADIDTAKEKVKAASGEMDISYMKLARSISSLTTAGLALEGTWSRVAEGQISVAEGALRSIPALVSLASAIYGVVGAETARTIAHSIAHAVASLGAAVPVIIAAAGAGAAIGYGAASMIPSRQFGGPIRETGPYFLHAGEYVLPRGAAGMTVHIYYPSFRNRSDMDYFVNTLERMGQA